MSSSQRSNRDMNNPIRVQHRLESTDCHKPSPKSPILWIYIYRYKYILSFMATCGPVSCGIRIFATQVFNDFPSFSVGFFLPGIPPFSPCFQRFSFVFFPCFQRFSFIFLAFFLPFSCRSQRTQGDSNPTVTSLRSGTCPPKKFNVPTLHCK